MFDVRSDRKHYGDLLRAPYGYHVEAAVGTTYGLEPETLLSVLIALCENEDPDRNYAADPVLLLKAIRRMSGKITVFCEAGQIKKPANPSGVYLLLEKMIVQVALKAARGMQIPAFHAKTWVLKYVNNEGHCRYRFVNLSRNLTADRSWDFSLALDSSDTVRQPEKTKPVQEFLRFLAEKCAPAGKTRSRVKQLAAELENVSLVTGNKAFPEEGWEILPLGIEPGKHPIHGTNLMTPTEPYTEAVSFHNLIAFSPFVSPEVLHSWNDRNRSLPIGTERILFTRRSELTKLKPEDVSRFKIYCLQDRVVDGEEMISDENTRIRQQDIHAKIYLRQKNSTVDLYLGSMNATHAAMNGNVEMMVRLRTTARHLSAESFLRDLFGGAETDAGNPFERAELPEQAERDPAEEDAGILEKVLKKLCREKLSATVKPEDSEGNRWSVEIQLPEPDGDIRATIRPMMLRTGLPFAKSVRFEGLSLLQLSSFYTVTLAKREAALERVIIIPTAGLPEKREDAVVQNVIRDRKAFMEYLALMLEDDHLQALAERIGSRSGGTGRNGSGPMPALYEKLLRAAMNSREKLLEIRETVEQLGHSEAVPENFEDLFALICETAKAGKKGV